MIKFKKLLLITVQAILISLLFFSQLHAQGGIEPEGIERVGLSGWQFLKINGDARQAAMGGAFTATSHGDAGAIWGNPSALVDVENLDMVVSYINWIADIGYQSAGVVKDFGNLGVIGLSVVSIDMGEMYETVNEPIPGEDRTRIVVTGEKFTAGDFAAGLSYAMRVTDLLSIGANVRWIHEYISGFTGEPDEHNMNNVSFDLGTTYYTGFKSLRLGMVMRNYGPDAHLAGWSQEYEAEAVDIRMPLDFRVGMAMDFFEGEENHFLTLSLEATHPNDGPEKVNMGAEYLLYNILALRAGYRFNYDEQSFTFGVSLAYPVGNFGIRFNYAYVDFGRLLQSNLFTLGLSF